ncbi:MAG: hypothetical protein EXQ97_06775 [Alphaproteobacteria bacterium]|nr:hypothetical protein [Alphaproteobacteria bacterium]
MGDESGIDGDELLRVARDSSSESRRQIVDTIDDLFEGEAGQLSAREREPMNDILRQIVHEVEVSVHKHLAIRLSDIVNGGTGNDTLDSGIGNDTVLGGADNYTAPFEIARAPTSMTAAPATIRFASS